MTESTVGSPTTAATCSPRRSCLVRSIGTKPTFLAWRSRASFMSPIMITAAPRSWAEAGGPRDADGTGTGDIDRRARLDARGQGSVEAGRQDVRQHGEVHDLGQGLVLVRELEQIEVRIGHHDVAGLAADPAAHVDIAVGAARATGIDRQAHAGIRLPAGAAPSTGDVERHRYEIAHRDH